LEELQNIWMKELNIFIKENDLSKVTDILQRRKAGITFVEVQGTGRTPKVTQEIVHFYQTGRKTTPKFIGRILVISIVPDPLAKSIIEEILNIFGEQKEPSGMLFVKEVSGAYEIGTKLTGDEVLYSQ
jgi:nitrogen regulatory protein P-II 1